MSGGTASMMFNHPATSPLRMKGEKPKSSPPTKATGAQDTHRRSRTYMASAERNGLRVSATLRVAIGPKAQVTGARTIPRPTSAVLESRLIPLGWNR